MLPSRNLLYAVLGVSFGLGAWGVSLGLGGAARGATQELLAPVAQPTGSRVLEPRLRPVSGRSGRKRPNGAKLQAAPQALAAEPDAHLGLRIAGRVLSSSGELPTGDPSQAVLQASHRNQSFRLALDEHWRFDASLPGEETRDWVLVCQSLNLYMTLVSEVALPARELVLRLPEAGRMGLRLLDRADRAALGVDAMQYKTGASAWLDIESFELDEHGIAWMDLPLGSLFLRARTADPGYFNALPKQAFANTRANEILELEVERGHDLRLRLGSLGDERWGDPYPRPRLLRPDGSRVHCKTELNEQGEWVYSRLHAGRFSLGGSPNLEFTPAEVQVGPGQGPALEVRWRVLDPLAYAEELADIELLQSMPACEY